MTWWQAVFVFVAGIAAGGINTIVGSGTLITFPTLLAVGLPPVTANVSNTLGLVPGSFTGAYGYRAELTGQRRRVLILCTACVPGAIVGALLLLLLPSSAFDAIVPVLIVIALLMVVLQPRLSRFVAARKGERTRDVGPLLWVGVLLAGVYGGYFGAAQGVLVLGMMGVLLAESLQRLNAVKNITTGLVNLVAAVVFIITAHLDWTAVGLIAVGSIIGGVIGARVGRRLSPVALRGVIVVVGVIAIVKLVFFN